MDKDFGKKADELLAALAAIRPITRPCSPEIRDWWDKTALPVLRDQALSELWHNDEYPPRLVGFMNKEGTDLGIVNVEKAVGGDWGSRASKDATAVVHKIAALVPGTFASVFCAEAWALHAKTEEELDRNYEKYPSMGDHPDRDEVVMFSMLHYERETNTMMQLSTMIQVIKVLGVNRSRAVWRDTKLADKVATVDPFAAGEKMTGRFIFGDPESPT